MRNGKEKFTDKEDFVTIKKRRRLRDFSKRANVKNAASRNRVNSVPFSDQLSSGWNRRSRRVKVVKRSSQICTRG